MVRHSEAKVSERETSTLAVEESSNSFSLLWNHSHHYNLTLVEVDLHAREELEAQQDEFQVPNCNGPEKSPLLKLLVIFFFASS
jgi:hypothetical protein